MMRELLDAIDTKVTSYSISVQEDDGTYTPYREWVKGLDDENHAPSDLYTVWGVSFTDQTIYLRPHAAGERGKPHSNQLRDFRRNVDRLAA